MQRQARARHLRPTQVPALAGSDVHPICLVSLAVPTQVITSQSPTLAQFGLFGVNLKALRLQQSHLTAAMLQQQWDA